MNKFIVTGGAGFIGSNIVRALNQRGHDDVIVVDNLNSPLKKRNLETLTVSDYLDRKAFREAFRTGKQEAVATVFHMGACSSTTETDAAYLDDNNVNYTRELCEWCLSTGSRFVYASSAATYGDGTLGYSDDDAATPDYRPLNLYGLSKQTFDLLAMQQGWLNRVVGLKFFNVYGPGEDHKGDMRSVVNKAFAQIRDTGEVTLFRSHRPDYADGEQNRDFIYVRDAVNVCLYFSESPTRNGLFNCGTGQARTWLDLARAVFTAMGREPNIRMIDMPEAIRDRYQYHTQAVMDKLRATGYTAPFTTLEDGVADYVTRYLQPQADAS